MPGAGWDILDDKLDAAIAEAVAVERRRLSSYPAQCPTCGAVIGRQNCVCDPPRFPDMTGSARMKATIAGAVAAEREACAALLDWRKTTVTDYVCCRVELDAVARLIRRR
jgi:hypothetical protein